MFDTYSDITFIAIGLKEEADKELVYASIACVTFSHVFKFAMTF